MEDLHQPSPLGMGRQDVAVWRGDILDQVKKKFQCLSIYVAIKKGKQDKALGNP